LNTDEETMTALPHSFTGPGLVDLQLNGYAGFDFNGDASAWSAEQFHRVRDLLAGRGVVMALPTLVTGDPQAMVARARRYAEIVSTDAELAAAFPRLHVEGPFLSPSDGPRGAHSKRWCRTPAEMPDFLDRMIDASGAGADSPKAGRIALFTLAPELPGAIELIERLAAAGICPAIGHTEASAEQLDRAVAAGARMSTHLGNGSHQMLPRLDNYVQRQLADDRLFAGFIADGHHMPFCTLKNFIRAKTLARSILVTDAVAAAEMGPGRYMLAGGMVEVTPAGRCSHPGEPNLAGSALTLDRAVINTALHCDVTFEQGWEMASTRPAGLVALGKPRPVTVQVQGDRFSA
jgi:N-acetylglucosamine-6-phosphate deacetylase